MITLFDKQIKPKGEKLDVAKNEKKEEDPMSEEINIIKKLAGLQENPLQRPPGASLKFGQDVGQKLSFDSADAEDIKMFAFKVGQILANDPHLKTRQSYGGRDFRQSISLPQSKQ